MRTQSFTPMALAPMALAPMAFAPAVLAGILATVARPAAAQTADAQTPDVEAILARHVEALGGETFSKAQSLKATGTFSFNGIDSAYTVYRQRPDRFRFEVETSRGTVVSAFDGETAWSQGPDRSGGLRIEEMEGDERQRFLDESVDFDNPLVEHQRKGNKVELVGETDLDGVPVYHLRVVLASGSEQQWFLARDDALPQRRITTAVHRRAGPYDRVWYYMEHQKVDGVVQPFYSEREDRQHVRAYTLENVEIGVEIDPRIFAMPASSAGAASAGDG